MKAFEFFTGIELKASLLLGGATPPALKESIWD
jgi:hypothetical protein